MQKTTHPQEPCGAVVIAREVRNPAQVSSLSLPVRCEYALAGCVDLRQPAGRRVYFMGKTSTLETRFHRHYSVDVSGCWLWTGSVDLDGYGRIGVEGIPRKAASVSWELHRGEISDGLIVCHKCDIPACVNPDHLFLGTCQDNTRDMLRKGRGGRTKLTIEQVQEIRRRINEGEKQKSLAAEFNISKQLVSAIKTGAAWGWMK